MSNPGSLRLETPEGIDVEIRPAGPVARGLAITIDSTITLLVTGVAGFGLAQLSEAGAGLFLLLYFVVEWFYPVCFEVLNRGQTPGKKAMGLRVVSGDATPIGWNDSFVRNLLRVVDFLPFFYLAGLVSSLISGRFQRLGDLAGNALVIHATPLADQARPDARESAGSEMEAFGAARLPVPLPAAEQRAIVAWAERRGMLSEERSVELADLLVDLTGDSGESGRRRLFQIANGILGTE